MSLTVQSSLTIGRTSVTHSLWGGAAVMYTLSHRQFLALNSPYLTIRGASGNREHVRIEGGSTTFIVNADHVTIADLTMSGPVFHHIQV